MNDAKHTYMILGLLVLVVVLLVMVLVKINEPANVLVDRSADNVMACREAIAAWNMKYPKGAAVNDAARTELSAIIDNCSSKIGGNQ